jgi:diguanylate cyclase (GGDEF)-like protein
MSIDLPTSLAIIGFTSAVAGALLLMSWLQHRNVLALVPWGIAFVLVAISAALIAARGAIPDIWSIAIANAILALAYGSMWSGARIFEGRPPRVIGALAGALIWLTACTIDAFYSTPMARTMLMTAIGITYSLLTAAEFWRPRDDALASRWLIIVLLLVHAAALPLRIPLAGSFADPHFDHVNLLIFVTFESVLVSMCAAYLFGSLVKERIAQRYKRASLIDPLTGVANRRAFLKQGARIVRRSRLARQSAALMLFDLDHFKSVNDTFGHPAGDGVLAAFCRVAEEHLRPADFLARLGGEEFACLLPDTPQQDAAAIAERVRAAFEATAHKLGQEPFGATVSVGVAAADDTSCDLPALIKMADGALYRAKQRGRNRVETSGSTDTLKPAPGFV